MSTGTFGIPVILECRQHCLQHLWFTISYIVPLLRILCQIKAKFIEHIAFCLSFSQLQKPILAQKE